MTILVEKGHIRRRRVGKAFAYKAVTPQGSAFRSMLRELVDASAGLGPHLLLNLIRSEKLSDEDISLH